MAEILCYEVDVTILPSLVKMSSLWIPLSPSQRHTDLLTQYHPQSVDVSQYIL